MFRLISIFSLLMLSFSLSAKAGPVAGHVMLEPVTGMSFVWLPKGCFEMGAGAIRVKSVHVDEAFVKRVEDNGVETGFVHVNYELDEQAFSARAGVVRPPAAAKAVCFNKGFWMASHEVTQSQYNKVMGLNPAGFNRGGNYPVEQVRWLDARAFIRKLNEPGNRQFRLPSEAEWEYAARSGGKDQPYGAAGSPEQAAWYMGNSSSTTHPVGQKQANALGLYDMSGNVWEWTADCWNESLEAVPADGSASVRGICTARVLRGGSWYDAKALLRTTSRLWLDVDKLDNNSGFRLVIDVLEHDL